MDWRVQYTCCITVAIPFKRINCNEYYFEQKRILKLQFLYKRRLFKKVKMDMFQNMMTQSQMYQSLFRNLPLVPQPGPTSSASFLVENLLREGHSALMSRPMTTVPTGVVGFPGLSFSSVPNMNLGRSPETLSVATSTANTNNVTPYLKFGVSAILGSDNTDSRSSKFVPPFLKTY